MTICVKCKEKRASYNYKNLKANYCGNCKEDGMINVANKRCKCGKTFPTYNFKGLKREYCYECKIDGMINVVNNKCDCGKIASFNFPNEIKPNKCSKCKTEGMINLTCKKCQCGQNFPSFNYDGLKAEFCSICKENEMVDVVHNKCKCGKSFPCYNYEGLKPEYCNSCKLDGMINSKDDKCKCKKSIATFNIKGLKAQFCKECKTDEMIDVKHKLCSGQGGLCVQRGNKKYKYYCTTCFQYEFPNDPLVYEIHIKSKENLVRDFINKNYEDFKHDKPIIFKECDCTHLRRIDHRKLIGNTLLCIETDEEQHKKYKNGYEEERYNDLYMIHSGKFVFVRFNPDKYKDKKGEFKNPPMGVRLERLKKEIDKQIERINKEQNTEPLEIVKLYYDKC